MGTKMLIDAAHPEETRVVVVQGNRVEDFDYESANRKQLRGNIYLAKVTRVEPSLQAAFVDYGGNRHGFLAFNEIHPDYYQIPVADRQALLQEEAEDETKAEAEAAAEDAGGKKKSKKRKSSKVAQQKADTADETVSEEPTGEEKSADAEPGDEAEAAAAQDAGEPDGESEPELSDAPKARGLVEDHGVHDVYTEAGAEDAEANDEADDGNGGNVEASGTEDALEELPERIRRRRRTYKIQEVIKRRQIILVQVVKEERGNKGAALTTYLSLAGRFTVLMPNTARGGGISRKITNANDRKRLRKIVGELDVPTGMGLIVRTAGASRTKAEIKRDFEYLLRLWENVRDLTLHSTAPSLVYEEGNLIKRSIRDLYNKDIDEVLVAGDEAHKEAKDFMRMLMPSHAKNVKPYREPAPIFTSFQIERQLGAMFSPEVTLKSGGYIVINQTEALVAIDVNSGKATREHNIEDTALKTNLEAVDEIARQLRLRDLAGLLVIDFIDMEERRNNRSVERRIKDALRGDRARIQIGRISPFGLLEMSRQRLRPGVLEGSTSPCDHCQGIGIVRSTESVALDVLRTLEDTLIGDSATNMAATTANDVALYILNQKRANLKDIEARYGIDIFIEADEQLHGANFKIARVIESDGEIKKDLVVQMDWGSQSGAFEDGGEVDKRAKRKRRRKRSKGESADANGESAEAGATRDERAAGDGDEKPAKSSKPRRRGRRGGRRVRAAAAKAEAAKQEQAGENDAGAETGPEAAASDAVAGDTAAPEAETKAEAPAKKPARAKRAKSASPRKRAKPKSTAKDPADEAPAEQAAPAAAENGGADPAKPAAKAKKQAAPEPKPDLAESDAGETSQRKGWWQKGA